MSKTIGRSEESVRRTVTSKDLRLIKEKIDEAVFPQWVITDPEIYELEKEKIFGRTWQFLGHESEISEEPGSYVTRWIVDDPVLLVRSKSGEIKAFLNFWFTERRSLMYSRLRKKENVHMPISWMELQYRRKTCWNCCR